MKVYRRCTRPRTAEALPSDVVEQLALGLGTSVISGGAVWIGQRLTISRRLRRRRHFLGLGRVYPRAHIIVGRKYGSTDSIHENDVAAALEIGNLLRAAGGETVDIVPAGASGQSAPDSVEFCLSGPGSNPRTGAHLRRYLPALEVGDKDAYVVSGHLYERQPGAEEYVLLARICRTDRPHLFLISGQTSVTNLAGAAYLARNEPALARRFGDRGSFAFILKVIDTHVYGHREAEEVGAVPVAP
jgi:hypothetical protein